MISDHRTKHQSSLPPSLNFDHLKKLLDVALITKDYRQASRYIQYTAVILVCYAHELLLYRKLSTHTL